MSRIENKNKTFAQLGLRPNLLKELDKRKFFHPTPIQEKTIPLGIEGNDVIGIAQTGTGKTLAFLVPTLQNISASKTQGLILLPTREMAMQVNEVIHDIVGSLGVRTAVLIGGMNMHRQIKQLKKRPHVIVATPGRLIDHLEQKNLKLNNVSVLVLDEADRMLDMGFEPQIKKVLAAVPDERQTLLFSATMPDRITKIVHAYMKDPVRVQVTPQGLPADKIHQELFLVDKTNKGKLLDELLDTCSGKVIVFSRTKHGAKKLTRVLRKRNIDADEIHSNRSQNQRKQALDRFRDGRCRVLIATDIAARGLDVDDIQLVINYDMPDQLEDYVHRIGRTARAGRSGKAVTLVTPDQRRDVKGLECLMKMELTYSELPEGIPAPSVKPLSESHGDRPRRSGGRRRGSYRPAGRRRTRAPRGQARSRTKNRVR